MSIGEMKGVWIPLKILHDKKLTMQEKFLFMEIYQLSTREYGCIGSNKHFGEVLNVSAKSASKSIGNLVKKGYIKTDIEPGSRNHNRTITVIHPGGDPYPPKVETLSTKGGHLSTKSGETIDNITYNKTESKSHPSEEQVLKMGKKLKIPEEVSLKFYLFYESKGWKDIIDYIPLLRKWGMTEKKNTQVEIKGGNKSWD